MKKMIVMLSCIAVLTGCATVFRTPHQPLTVITSNDKHTGSTQCRLTNEEGEWTTSAFVEAKVHRDDKPLHIRCENEEQVGEVKAKPQFKAAFLALNFISDFCLVSCIIDAATNAMFDYGTTKTVVMEDKREKPASP